MSHALQQHGRGIAKGFPGVTHRQAADCGELVSMVEGDEEGEEEEGLSRTQQIGIGLALLVLLIGTGAALGGA